MYYSYTDFDAVLWGNKTLVFAILSKSSCMCSNSWNENCLFPYKNNNSRPKISQQDETCNSSNLLTHRAGQDWYVVTGLICLGKISACGTTYKVRSVNLCPEYMGILPVGKVERLMHLVSVPPTTVISQAMAISTSFLVDLFGHGGGNPCERRKLLCHSHGFLQRFRCDSTTTAGFNTLPASAGYTLEFYFWAQGLSELSSLSFWGLFAALVNIS